MSIYEFPFEEMKYDYPKHKFYAVKIGRNPGIYREWKDCLKQIETMPNAEWKGFEKEHEAEEYINPFCFLYEGQLTLDDFFKKKGGK